MNNLNLPTLDHQALFGLTLFDRLSFKKIEILKNFFGNYQNIFSLPQKDFSPFMSDQIILDFLSWRQSFSFCKEWEKLKKEKINWFSLLDNNYPNLLKEIASPPLGLFYKGSLSALSINYNYLAVVGSRQADNYANRVIEKLIPDLIKNQITIVSGLALGVDALAHWETLKNQGITIAVLGTGLDKQSFFPKSNWLLAEEIIKNNGLLLSEFPLNTPAWPQNFPRRNRIVAGLCQATLIIQAMKKSGSLITANLALEQNREVLAISGNIFSKLSEGTNNLIKLGAKPITKPSDILEIYE